MLKIGLLAEVPAPPEHAGLGWRQNEASVWIALRITDMGLASIGLESAGLAPVRPLGATEAAMTSNTPPELGGDLRTAGCAPAGRLTLRVAAAAVITAWESDA